MMKNALTVLTVMMMSACSQLPGESNEVGQAKSNLLDEPGVMAGNWTGTSYFVPAGIAGVVTASFTASTKQTFSGTMHFDYPAFGFSEDCRIAAGQVTTAGAMRVTAFCVSESFRGGSGGNFDCQLSEDRNVLTGTFGGANGNNGTITLTRTGASE